MTGVVDLKLQFCEMEPHTVRSFWLWHGWLSTRPRLTGRFGRNEQLIAARQINGKFRFVGREFVLG